MNSQSQYIRELGQEIIKSNKLKCKSKATDQFDSQKVIHEDKPRNSEATPIWFHELKRWIASKLFVCERSYTFFVLNSSQCFIQYPDSSKKVLQNLAALFCSNQFSVSEYHTKHSILCLILIILVRWHWMKPVFHFWHYYFNSQQRWGIKSWK